MLSQAAHPQAVPCWRHLAPYVRYFHLENHKQNAVPQDCSSAILGVWETQVLCGLNEVTALKTLPCNVAASPFRSSAEAGGCSLRHMPLAVRPWPRSLVATEGAEETPCGFPEPSMHGGFNPSLSVLMLYYSAHIWKQDVFLFLKQEALCFPREVPHIIMWEFRNQMPRS